MAAAAAPAPAAPAAPPATTPAALSEYPAANQPMTAIGQQRRDPGVHMLQLARGHTALRALVEVLAQTALGPHPQPAPGVGAEPVRVLRVVAPGCERLAHMGLEVRLLEPFAGPTGQDGGGGAAVRPKSGAISLGDSSSTVVCQSTACQRSGRLRNASMAIDCSASCIASTSAPRSRVSSSESSDVREACAANTAEVVDQVLPLGALRPGGGDMADCGHQIGPDGLLRPLAAPYGLERAREHLGGQVVGGVPVPAALRAYRRTAPEWRRNSSS
ncbi:hypothetical protein SMICM17S_07279 [Streptomyces microflavus]